MTARKIIIDTDPGIDDAFAILYALRHPELDVLALTAVFGNVPVALAARNAARLVELAGADTPVAIGAAAPLLVPPHPHPATIHGADGFGDTGQPEPNGAPIGETAAETIVRLIRAHPGEVTLVPVGPLTNIAQALELAPDIAEKAAGVALMGGAARVAGNITPVAEANIYHDPHAAERVFMASWPVSMVGLDVTMKLPFVRADLDEMASASPQLGGFLRKIAGVYVDFYRAKHDLDGIVPHDLVALFTLTEPQRFQTLPGRIAVATDGPARGTTVFWQENRELADEALQTLPVQRAFVGIEAEGLFASFLQTLAGPD